MRPIGITAQTPWDTFPCADGTHSLSPTIGNLAETTGTPVETIRFYEREGLLPAAHRSENNYRFYTTEHADRLAFIRHCRNLDMALNEIRALLRLRDAPPENCGEVNSILDEHIGHVAERIRELRVLEKDLKALRARCSSPDAIDQCGILNQLDGPAAPGPKAPTHRHIRGSH